MNEKLKPCPHCHNGGVLELRVQADQKVYAPCICRGYTMLETAKKIFKAGYDRAMDDSRPDGKAEEVRGVLVKLNGLLKHINVAQLRSCSLPLTATAIERSREIIQHSLHAETQPPNEPANH